MYRKQVLKCKGKTTTIDLQVLPSRKGGPYILNEAQVMLARQLPYVDEALGDQQVELALGHDVVGDVETAILPHQRLVGACYLQEPGITQTRSH
jgi:hypothetical protein